MTFRKMYIHFNSNWKMTKKPIKPQLFQLISETIETVAAVKNEKKVEVFIQTRTIKLLQKNIFC